MPKFPPSQRRRSRTAHVPWPSPRCRICVAFRGPAYSDEKKDKAALDLLAQIAFGENSDSYQQLVLKEQKLDRLPKPIFEASSADPELFSRLGREVKDRRRTWITSADQILDDIQAQFKTELNPQAKLDCGHALAASLRICYGDEQLRTAIAGALALLHRACGARPMTIDKLFGTY